MYAIRSYYALPLQHAAVNKIPDYMAALASEGYGDDVLAFARAHEQRDSLGDTNLSERNNFV